MFVSKTFSIRDAVYYHESAFTSTQTLSIPNIPTNFKMSFKNKRVSGTSWVEIGSNTNNNLFTGQIGGGGMCGIYVRVNGDYQATKTSSDGLIGANSTALVEYSYEDGVQTTKVNNETISLTNSSITARSYQKINISSTNQVSELLIMPL